MKRENAVKFIFGFIISCLVSALVGISIWFGYTMAYMKYQPLQQERDMYKSRWEIRDKAATYYYNQYKEVKERYDLIKDLNNIKKK